MSVPGTCGDLMIHNKKQDEKRKSFHLAFGSDYN